MSQEKQLIDAEFLKDNIIFDSLVNGQQYDNNIIDIIKKQPTYNLKTEYKGEWIKDLQNKTLQCPFCHLKFSIIQKNNFNYCPNCGAEMKEDYFYETNMQ